MSAAELKAAAPEASKTIDILDFVKESSIDPRYFDTPYYFRPDRNGDKAYALLRDAIHESGLVGIAKFTLRQKERLAGIKPMGDALMLEMMRFTHELVDVSDIAFPKAQRAKVTVRECAWLASSSSRWRRNGSRRNTRTITIGTCVGMIQAKLKGKKITPAREPEAAEPRVLDLMGKLRESLERGAGTRGAGTGHAKAKRSSRKRAVRRPA